jgi:hypothetical protein
MINYTRCAREIKATVNLEKTAFNKTKTRFISRLDLNLTKKVVKGCIWSIALYGAENWMLRKQIENNWKVSECGAGEGWRYHWDLPCEKWRSVIKRVKEEGNILQTVKKERLTGLVTSCLGTVF